jgi:hypothetical protein
LIDNRLDQWEFLSIYPRERREILTNTRTRSEWRKEREEEDEEREKHLRMYHKRTTTGKGDKKKEKKERHCNLSDRSHISQQLQDESSFYFILIFLVERNKIEQKKNKKLHVVLFRRFRLMTPLH